MFGKVENHQPKASTKMNPDKEEDVEKPNNNQDNDSQRTSTNMKPIIEDSECTDCEETCDSDGEGGKVGFDNIVLAVDLLRKRAFKFNITHTAMKDLLDILMQLGIETLPNDPRTLLSTPRKVETIAMGTGKYWHNGFIILSACKTLLQSYT